MTDNIKNKIDSKIKNRFYYIEYPEGTTENVWKDQNGKNNFMENISLDHLQNAIKRVEKDRKAFLERHKHDMNGPELTKRLLQLIDKKLQELKEMLNRKAGT